MKENQLKLSELQEILLWQQLNKQLMELKDQGKPIKEKHHKYLHKFSFENRLFSKVTENPLIDEIPLALFTDFSEICFVTIKLELWNACLTRLIPNTHILEIEGALANSFDKLGEYDKKYYLTEGETDATNSKLERSHRKKPSIEELIATEDDDDLYIFINEYLQMREAQERNFGNMILRLYLLKSAALTNMLMRYNYLRFLKKEKDTLVLDYYDFEGRDSFTNFYRETFSSMAYSIIKPMTPYGGATELVDFLRKKGTQKDIKPSISTFIEKEIPILEKAIDLFDRFYREIALWEHSNFEENDAAFKIGICSTSAFFFLEDPLPEV